MFGRSSEVDNLLDRTDISREQAGRFNPFEPQAESQGSESEKQITRRDSDSQLIAMTRQHIGDGNLPDAYIGRAGDGSDQISDATAKPPVVDANGRVQQIEYPDGKTREFKYDANGEVVEYKDRNGHTWIRNPEKPDEWKRSDGKDTLHGKMIVGKDGSFTFINQDKGYVSHYGADGEEKVDAQKPFTSYTQAELQKLEQAGTAFDKTGIPQEPEVSHSRKKQTDAETPTSPPDRQKEDQGEKKDEQQKSTDNTQQETAPPPDRQKEEQEEKKDEQQKSTDNTQQETAPPPDRQKEEQPPQKSGNAKDMDAGEADTADKADKGYVADASTKPEPIVHDKKYWDEIDERNAYERDRANDSCKPLGDSEVAKFSETFPTITKEEIARIGSMKLSDVRKEMRKEPIMSRKRLFYGEMVYRLTNGFTTKAWPQDNEPKYS